MGKLRPLLPENYEPDDDRFWTSFFVAANPSFVRMAEKYVEDVDGVKHIVSEAFQKVYQNRGQFKETKEVWRYTMTAIKNTAINYAKQHQRDGRRTTYIEMETLDDSIVIPVAHNTWEVRQLRHKFLKLIETLPPDHAEAIYLTFYEHRSNVEIATIMNLKVARVKQLKTKGLKMLRNRLEGYHQYRYIFISLVINQIWFAVKIF